MINWKCVSARYIYSKVGVVIVVVFISLLRGADELGLSLLSGSLVDLRSQIQHYEQNPT